MGVNDMVRISDARMSGTAYGTVVLHASPRSRAGGPLALVQTGDMVTLNVPKRLLQLDVDDNTLAARRANWTSPPLPDRGWLSFTSNMSSKQTRAQISISSWERADRTWRATRIEHSRGAFVLRSIPQTRSRG